eukprot:2893330-Rhodomonas_salina.1
MAAPHASPCSLPSQPLSLLPSPLHAVCLWSASTHASLTPPLPTTCPTLSSSLCSARASRGIEGWGTVSYTHLRAHETEADL